MSQNNERFTAKRMGETRQNQYALYERLVKSGHILPYPAGSDLERSLWTLTEDEKKGLDTTP